ncbi:hypothetical protein JYU34_002251 [Plutella xylostella]|uniref:Uncharacterized protein n=1 Tax=Plutella xylostella TaxID=51655 RepID=A0ABQ7R1U0_PLUXY|nr:hypothetical protein JYU34_002251 [Plutella xylostella]
MVASSIPERLVAAGRGRSGGAAPGPSDQYAPTAAEAPRKHPKPPEDRRKNPNARRT